MLKKLFRQEIKVQGKTVTGMYGVLAAATLLLIGLFYIGKIAGQGVYENVFVIGCMLYVITMIVVAVGIFIYLCYHFYKSMYSEQGYLTHTLPVKTAHILNAKIAVSFGFLFITVILCILSFCIIGMTIEGMPIKELIDLIGKVIADSSQTMHISGFACCMMILVSMIFGSLDALLLFFAGSSIGQLFHRSKGACGIAAGIGLYYVSQILSIVAIFLGYLLYEALPAVRNMTFVMVGACMVALIWTVIYYMICKVIVEKHLNLE